MSPSDPLATSTPAPSTAAPSALRLQFRGGQHDGQVVRINSAKCTIGAAENATLRLRCPGVHPIHCLILMGQAGMVVRRMAPDTFLNGEAFEDAKLSWGDRLTIGPIEFDLLSDEVIDDPQKTDDAPPATEESSSAAPDETASLRSRIDALETTNRQLVTKLHELSTRYEELNAKNAEDSAQLQQSQIQQQAATAEKEKLAAELAGLGEQVQQLETLNEERQTLRSEVGSLQEQLEQAQSTATQHAADLSTAAEKLVRFDSLQSSHEDLSREVVTLRQQMDQAEEYCAKWEAQHEKLENDLSAANLLNAEKDNELQALRARLGDTSGQVAEVGPPVTTPPVQQVPDAPVAQPVAVDVPAEPLTPPVSPVSPPPTQTMSMDELQSFDDETPAPAESAPPLNTVNATMIFEGASDFEEEAPAETPQDSALAMLDKLRAELGAPPARPSTPEVEPEAAVAPAPTVAEQPEPAAVVATPDEEEIVYAAPDSAPPVDTASILAKFGHVVEEEPGEPTPPPTPEPISAADAEQSEDDASIQDYMAQLMQRVGGDGEAAKPAAKKSPATPEKPAKVSSTPQVAKPVTKPKPAPAKPLDPSEFVPRAVAPEATAGLKALRAVANTSTRSAIDRHQRRSLDSKALLSGLLALVAFGVSAAMGYLALGEAGFVSLPTLLCLTSGFIGVLAMVKALAYSARSAIGNRRQQNLKQLSAR